MYFSQILSSQANFVSILFKVIYPPACRKARANNLSPVSRNSKASNRSPSKQPGISVSLDEVELNEGKLRVEAHKDFVAETNFSGKPSRQSFSAYPRKK
jgi:hypothetical protein